MNQELELKIPHLQVKIFFDQQTFYVKNFQMLPLDSAYVKYVVSHEF